VKILLKSKIVLKLNLLKVKNYSSIVKIQTKDNHNIKIPTIKVYKA
jgi:hypothetical protein